MADKPILFSAPMVKALLAGTKTQTRRAPSAQPAPLAGNHLGIPANARDMVWPISPGRSIVSGKPFAPEAWVAKHVRYGVGDRLYVREHWRTWDGYDAEAPRDLKPPVGLFYEADRKGGDHVVAGKFRQGMHMPRWASRITLTVTDVRVQRLQDISEEDAQAEGVSDEFTDYELYGQSKPYKYGYSALWQSINGPGSWDLNPWVAAYTFTVAMGNIDDLARAAC